MEHRMYPWRDKPGDLVSSRILSAQRSRLFLVQERGPTSFVVMADTENESNAELGSSSSPSGSNTKPRRYRVLIGSPQACSCRDSSDICIHLLFIMIKVLGLSPENPLIWQRALLDREISEILSGKHRCAASSKKSPDTSSSATMAAPVTSDQMSKHVSQRMIDNDDMCSICMDPLNGSTTPLTFCRSGCGNSVHQECMRVWAQYRQSIGEQVSCPLCRSDDWAPLPRKSSVDQTRLKRTYHRHVQCAACSGRLAGSRFTCALCPQYDLCHVCVRTQISRHQHGPSAFMMKSSPTQPFRPMSADEDFVEALMGLLKSKSALDLHCVFCNFTAIGRKDNFVELPCGHNAHRSCLVDRLSQPGVGDLAVCRLDGQNIFLGLAPRRLSSHQKQSQQQNTYHSKTHVRPTRRTRSVFSSQLGPAIDLSLCGHGFATNGSR